MATQVTQDMVEKVGKLALTQQAFAERLDGKNSPTTRRALVNQAQNDAVGAIDAEGLSVEDYNAVVTAAEVYPTLEQRLLDAACAVL